MKAVLSRITYPVLALSFFALSAVFLVWMSRQSDWHDFDVFYDAARAAMQGTSIYIIVGRYSLPFWYPPWTAWMFIPFAVWPRQVGLALYQGISLGCAVTVVHHLVRHYSPNFCWLNELVILALLVPLSVELVGVGQMEYLFLGLVVLIIWAADTGRPAFAGAIYPLLLAKPHLIIPFTLFLFLRLGRPGVISASLASLSMVGLATFLSPGWYLDMFQLLEYSGQRTAGLAFTTFPSMLGRTENWIGTANIPFTILLILAAILILARFRTLPTVPFLSLALSLSLLSAPRAYGYDLPLHIPTLVWLTATSFRSKAWIWFVAAILPEAVGFSSLAYLATLLVGVLGIRKALGEAAATPEVELGT